MPAPMASPTLDTTEFDSKPPEECPSLGSRPERPSLGSPRPERPSLRHSLLGFQHHRLLLLFLQVGTQQVGQLVRLAPRVVLGVADELAASVGIAKQALAPYQVLVILSILVIVRVCFRYLAVGDAGEDSKLLSGLVDRGSGNSTILTGFRKSPLPGVDQDGTIIGGLESRLVKIAIGALEFGREVTERERVLFVESIVVQVIGQNLCVEAFQDVGFRVGQAGVEILAGNLGNRSTTLFAVIEVVPVIISHDLGLDQQCRSGLVIGPRYTSAIGLMGVLGWLGAGAVLGGTVFHGAKALAWMGGDGTPDAVLVGALFEAGIGGGGLLHRVVGVVVEKVGAVDVVLYGTAQSVEAS